MKKLLLPFVLAGCCLSPTMRLQAEYIKYKDPLVSIPERVDDLMSRMTPEEKRPERTCALNTPRAATSTPTPPTASARPWLQPGDAT